MFGTQVWSIISLLILHLHHYKIQRKSAYLFYKDTNGYVLLECTEQLDMSGGQVSLKSCQVITIAKQWISICFNPQMNRNNNTQ